MAISDTPAGAQANALCITIVEMAKIYDLDLYKYIEYILSSRPTSESIDEELAKLVPLSQEVQDICKTSITESHTTIPAIVCGNLRYTIPSNHALTVST